MKVDRVVHWMGRERPLMFLGVGPFEVTMEDLDVLLVTYSVAFMHYFEDPIPTNRALRKGAKMPEACIMMALDDKGKRFTQR